MNYTIHKWKDHVGSIPTDRIDDHLNCAYISLLVCENTEGKHIHYIQDKEGLKYFTDGTGSGFGKYGYVDISLGNMTAIVQNAKDNCSPRGDHLKKVRRVLKELTQ